MTIELIFFLLSAIILFIASLFDLRSREVPDTLSYFLLLAVLGISLLYALNTNNFSFFLHTLGGACLFFAGGYLLYRAKQMGGADVKLLASLGGIFANFSLFSFSLMAIFFFLILSIGATYTLLWGTVLYLKSFRHANKKARELLQAQKAFRFGLVCITLGVFVSLFFIENISLRILLVATTLTLILLFYLSIFLRVIEKLHFLKEIPVTELTEGDWLAKDVYRHGKLICSASHVCLDQKQIASLKKAKVDRVLIKVGIPFVPAIFLANMTTFILYLIF